MVPPAVGRLIGALHIRRLNGQAVAIGVASLMLVSGLSTVVVASRSSTHASLPAAPALEHRGGSAEGTVIARATPPAPLPFGPGREQPLQSVAPAFEPAAQPQPSEPEAEPVRAQPATEPHVRHAEIAKRPAPAAPVHKHHRSSYSAERDLMLPSFMQPGAQPQSAPPPRPTWPSSGPAPSAAARPAPARPMFSR